MVIITDATEADLGQIFQIETESFDDPYPYSLLRTYLFLANKLYLVAKEGEKIIGYIIGIIQYGYRGHIVSIAVEPAYRKKGIGTKLLSEIEERFKLNGAKYSYLEVNINNLPAISFYQENGYLIMYIRRNYYGRSKHAFVMIKNLYYKFLD
ncbi:ribosomal-protein-alanine acetyltransferase [Sulfolobus islandicus Y.N.15.51]|jgi:ribosomal-protein-alanine N-acetyltransferase|uniref:Ribosomal-protein-alanine acetyltransferase n=1 Tax=Saccharolobus islandicus (strain Y.N.15.51 / Yellowstone \|nr:ribosomal protein S18-alanine N-acetyltransferase [Sulfolobus islandicus]ACP47879.1 ribosomal-protein-alanine acetyltransferase [Sulfolobus islandicus Y.N.15.51]PVU78151.1 ribosomal-protein-alanine N-acetyltransferase [Sulfolobus islandicus]